MSSGDVAAEELLAGWGYSSQGAFKSPIAVSFCMLQHVGNFSPRAVGWGDEFLMHAGLLA